jgi:hypothetical protein
MCAVRATIVHRHIDSQSAMHGARVQLHRLRQTDGEPYGKNAGEAAKKPMMTHASNIGG